MEQYVVLPDSDAPRNNETIHNVPHPKMEVRYVAPLLSFGWEDEPNEIEPSHASGLQSFQSCLEHEGYSFSQVGDTPADDESIVDEIIDSKKITSFSGC